MQASLDQVTEEYEAVLSLVYATNDLEGHPPRSAADMHETNIPIRGGGGIGVESQAALPLKVAGVFHG